MRAASTGANTIGFFLPKNTSEGGYAIMDAMTDNTVAKMTPQTAQQIYNQKIAKRYVTDKSYSVKGGHGYNTYFVVAAGKELSPLQDDMDTSAVDVSALASQFTDFAKGKRNSKVFLTEFAKSIA